ncbi:hypothetical protein HPB48_018822 [Haemaphysalis longicornis]|uniref:Uncharacterized protein n=1 Tax=Haemaphysalis longicornis TaxID=44386 RepID=A0A9J6G0D8_HAELO|nr:hypothetical protein HPB48_018822 [Haemaphysalis longicornis]
MGLPCATPERQPAPDPTATGVVGRHLLCGFGLPGRLRNGGPGLADVPSFPARRVSSGFVVVVVVVARTLPATQFTNTQVSSFGEPWRELVLPPYLPPARRPSVS